MEGKRQIDSFSGRFLSLILLSLLVLGSFAYTLLLPFFSFFLHL